MGPNPQVIGIILGDHNQYRGLLYAIPNHNQGERPRYTHDDLWHFKYGTNDKDQFDSTLEFLHDLSLMAEVSHFHKASCLFFQYQEEIHKLKEPMWEAGQLKDVSGCGLEGTNTLHRIEEALVELNRWAAAW